MIGEMIVVDCQPISIVESSPKYHIPSRSYYSAGVHGAASTIKGRLRGATAEDNRDLLDR